MTTYNSTHYDILYIHNLSHLHLLLLVISQTAASGGAAAKRAKLDPADIDIEKEAKASRVGTHTHTQEVWRDKIWYLGLLSTYSSLLLLVYDLRLE